MNERIIQIRKQLKATLHPLRYEHSLSVSYTCMSLAMCYGFSLEKAELAGLLHDCAKQFNESVLLVKCDRHKISLTAEERSTPAVVHAKYGAWMARYLYQIEDEEILQAISCHTTGKPQMSMLDQIVYVSDYIEPRRFKAANLTAIRALAYADLQESLYVILESTLNFLSSRNTPIHPLTQQAFDYYHSCKSDKPSVKCQGIKGSEERN